MVQTSIGDQAQHGYGTTCNLSVSRQNRKRSPSTTTTLNTLTPHPWKWPGHSSQGDQSARAIGNISENQVEKSQTDFRIGYYAPDGAVDWVLWLSAFRHFVTLVQLQVLARRFSFFLGSLGFPAAEETWDKDSEPERLHRSRQKWFNRIGLVLLGICFVIQLVIAFGQSG